ncbi:hypothetical protein, partial [Halpernia frigidisoli]
VYIIKIFANCSICHIYKDLLYKIPANRNTQPLCVILAERNRIRKFMNRKNKAYFLILASLILLVLNVTELNFENLKENRYSSIASNLLLILAMILTIKNTNKKENENK